MAALMMYAVGAAVWGPPCGSSTMPRARTSAGGARSTAEPQSVPSADPSGGGVCTTPQRAEAAAASAGVAFCGSLSATHSAPPPALPSMRSAASRGGDAGELTAATKIAPSAPSDAAAPARTSAEHAHTSASELSSESASSAPPPSAAAGSGSASHAPVSRSTRTQMREARHCVVATRLPRSANMSRRRRVTHRPSGGHPFAESAARTSRTSCVAVAASRAAAAPLPLHGTLHTSARAMCTPVASARAWLRKYSLLPPPSSPGAGAGASTGEAPLPPGCATTKAPPRPPSPSPSVAASPLASAAWGEGAQHTALGRFRQCASPGRWPAGCGQAVNARPASHVQQGWAHETPALGALCSPSACAAEGSSSCASGTATRASAPLAQSTTKSAASRAPPCASPQSGA
mmetsp:Transcript_4173/g.16760  ORF Transcript_4173/g.16760 Transcript_4173/m.16760 type:complete len:404 (+) Transcript_4173:675-1886(+)